MADNYSSEITKDGKFQCYITGKKGLDYMTECDVDFKAAPYRARLFISEEADKSEEGMKKLEDFISKAGVNDKFTCFISGVIYNVKQELVFYLEPKQDSFFDKPLFISRTS